MTSTRDGKKNRPTMSPVLIQNRKNHQYIYKHILAHLVVFNNYLFNEKILCVHVFRDDSEASGESVGDDWIFGTVTGHKPSVKQNGVVKKEELHKEVTCHCLKISKQMFFCKTALSTIIKKNKFIGFGMINKKLVVFRF